MDGGPGLGLPRYVARSRRPSRAPGGAAPQCGFTGGGGTVPRRRRSSGAIALGRGPRGRRRPWRIAIGCGPGPGRSAPPCPFRIGFGLGRQAREPRQPQWGTASPEGVRPGARTAARGMSRDARRDTITACGSGTRGCGGSTRATMRAPCPRPSSRGSGASSPCCARPGSRATWISPAFGCIRCGASTRTTGAVAVSGNWRIVFRFEAGEAVDVDLVDYH